MGRDGLLGEEKVAWAWASGDVSLGELGVFVITAIGAGLVEEAGGHYMYEI